MFDAITVKDLKTVIKNMPDSTKVIISTINNETNTISQDFARNISESTDNSFIIIGNKPLFSTNHN